MVSVDYFFMVLVLCCLYLCSCNGITRLGEVRAHVALEVEVSQHIVLGDLEKAGKLGVRVNLTAIGLVLKVVLANVLVDVASDLSASHLSSRGLGKEGGKLVADASGLDKSAGGTGTRLALALRALLLGDLKITSPLLLESAVLSLEGIDESTKLLELDKELTGLLHEGGIHLSNCISGSSNNRCGGRGRSRGSSSLSLHNGLLGLCGRGRGSSNGCGGSSSNLAGVY